MESTHCAFDLHTHSTASDGTLSPSQLVIKAQEAGVQVLALTDHDTIAGLAEAQVAAKQHGLELVPGIELSVTWNGRLLHIVGLNIDPECGPLQEGLRRLQAIRERRAEEIGRRLAQIGIEGAYEEVKRLAGDAMITRTHFARFLIGRGHATDFKDVFRRLLARGKPGYVATDWAKMDEAICWIRESGGVAVLAHPMRYRLTSAWMSRVLAAFKAAAGTSIEVVCGGNLPHETATSTGYALRYGLSGSVGSDYHGPENPWIRLGHLANLPLRVEPVWNTWWTTS